MRSRYPVLILFLAITFSSSAGAAEPPLSGRYSLEIKELGDLLDSSGYAEVLEKGAVLLPLVRADEPGGSFDEAKILDFMVHACYRSSRVMDPEAIVMGEQAVAMKEALLGPDDPELANSLMHLGNLYSRRWEGEKAIPQYERAVAILEKAGPGFDDQRAIILSSEGVAYRRLAQNLKALELYDQALEIQETALGPDHPDIASTLNNKAMVLGERGDYSAGVKLHRQALAIRQNHFGPDHEWVGESANNLASQLGYLGQYEESLAYQEMAVRIFKDQLGTDHQRYWWARLNLGIAYLDMGDPAGALPICEDVVDGLNKRYGKDHPQSCYALDALANCHFELGEYEKALEIYTESLRIGEAAFGVGSYETADTILRQGKCLTELERLDEAVDRLGRSLEIWQSTLEEDNALLCELLNRLAELHLQRQDYEQALIHAAQSSDISRRDLGQGHPLLAASSLLEGRAELGLGHEDAALAKALLAEEISRRHLQQTMRVLAEDRALDYAGTRVEGLDLALSVLKDGESGPRVARVWDAVIHSRSAVLDEYTRRNRYLSDRDDPLTAALLDSSLVLRERLANLTMRGPGWEELSVYHQLLTDTEADLNAVDRQLSLRSAEYRKAESDGHFGFEEVAENLPPESALTAFVRCTDESGQETYKAFILDRSGGNPRLQNLGDAGRIDAAVVAWRDQATLGFRQAEQGSPSRATRGFVKVARNADQQLASYTRAGRDLRRLVWDPVAADLGANRSVFIVADGSLHLVSFASLPTDDDLFLVETDHLLHLLNAEKSLDQNEATRSGPGRLLALGGADFQGTAGLTREGLEFDALPYARTEVEQVSTIWSAQGGQATLLAGSQADEEHLKNNLPQTQVLHLATHGFFLPEDNGLAGDPRWDNPLVRSGLALAGANGGPQPEAGNQDGILTAEEVSSLDLASVQWAVLSACDTGLGDLDERGEGVFGLRRVFTLAGAKTVIMSLWSVDDESSCDWMSALYRARWQDDLSTAASVRKASLDVLASRRAAGLSVHPYYWAGFVAAGDWR